jgi:hypothetical protein
LFVHMQVYCRLITEWVSSGNTEVGEVDQDWDAELRV